MSNLNDIINLAKADGGKFFVINEEGDVKLVIMNVEDYQQMLLGKLQKQIQDVESINQEILKAQLTDEPAVSPVVVKGPPATPEAASGGQWRAGPTLTSNGREHHQAVDLREEVIDPSFDFEGPKVEIDDL